MFKKCPLWGGVKLNFFLRMGIRNLKFGKVITFQNGSSEDFLSIGEKRRGWVWIPPSPGPNWVKSKEYSLALLNWTQQFHD